MEITSIAAVIGILKNLKDLTRNLGDDAPPELREQILALSDGVADTQLDLLTAQQREGQLTERCRKLEDELARTKDWEAQKGRYVLDALHDGATVYIQRLDLADPEAPHWLCTYCFENGQKSHLQPQTVGGGVRRFDREWRCPGCSATITTTTTKPKNPKATS